jgi:hypothetical protein
MKKLPEAGVWVGFSISHAEIRYEVKTDAEARRLKKRLAKQGFDAHFITRRENAARLNGVWK